MDDTGANMHKTAAATEMHKTTDLETIIPCLNIIYGSAIRMCRISSSIIRHLRNNNCIQSLPYAI
jgi:hypothetical protein